jgi:hypothetical protein
MLPSPCLRDSEAKRVQELIDLSVQTVYCYRDAVSSLLERMFESNSRPKLPPLPDFRFVSTVRYHREENPTTPCVSVFERFIRLAEDVRKLHTSPAVPEADWSSAVDSLLDQIEATQGLSEDQWTLWILWESDCVSAIRKVEELAKRIFLARPFDVPPELKFSRVESELLSILAEQNRITLTLREIARSLQKRGLPQPSDKTLRKYLEQLSPTFVRVDKSIRTHTYQITDKGVAAAAAVDQASLSSSSR